MNKVLLFLLVTLFFATDLVVTSFIKEPFILFTRITFYLALLSNIFTFQLLALLSILIQISIYSCFGFTEYFWLVFSFFIIKYLKQNVHQYFFTKFLIALVLVSTHTFLINSDFYSKASFYVYLKEIFVFSIIILSLMTFFERGRRGNRLGFKDS